MHEPLSKDLSRTWHPDYLVKWLFSQDTLWVTAKGEVVEVASMDPEHALNTLCFLERVADDFPFGRDTLQSKPLYVAIRQRVLDILVSLPKRMPGPLFVARKRPDRASWAVEKVLADGTRVGWDYPLTEQEARALARRRNRDAAGLR